ncbi:MAG: type IV pilus assembly protein FimV [Gammaproteobacteria bacterium]
MITTAQVISCPEAEKSIPDMENQELAFLFAKTRRDFNLEWLHDHPELLHHLVNAIAKQPKNLLVHMQRIYLCYQQDLPEQLYGALTDLFIVLNRRSIAFSSRILSAVSSKLSEPHYKLLHRYLVKKDFPPLHLPQNAYSVLGKGFIGTSQLLVRVHEKSTSKEHDPLQLARDYIEYSQLQEALEVLEKAVSDDPKREALHSDLLELYKSLHDVEGFQRMRQQLSITDNPFHTLWDEADNFFRRQ